MSCGSYRIGDKYVSFGFFSVQDWLDSIILSFPAPWTIGSDTHYGTEIFDARGKKLFAVWMAFGQPSSRQKGEMTDEQWRDYCSDSHWESETQWHVANAIVTARNSFHDDLHSFLDSDEQRALLRSLILNHARWDEDINAEITCGGPDRRKTDDDPEVIAATGGALRGAGCR